MGVNAQTTVPKFTAGQILTAAQQTAINTGVPVFATTTTRDAAFGGSNKTLAQGQFCYLESTGKLQVYTGSAWANVATSTNVATFTASGTWTVPTGVTYAIAYIRAGGGGVGSAASGTGGTSSVAFAGGTQSATGGLGMNFSSLLTATSVAGTAGSGNGASVTGYWAGGPYLNQSGNGPQSGALITAGGAVTPGASITVTVGSGGVAGTAFATGAGAAGGTGYVYITYEV